MLSSAGAHRLNTAALLDAQVQCVPSAWVGQAKSHSSERAWVNHPSNAAAQASQQRLRRRSDDQRAYGCARGGNLGQDDGGGVRVCAVVSSCVCGGVVCGCVCEDVTHTAQATHTDTRWFVGHMS